MADSNGAPDDNLRQKTETYCRRVVAVNEEDKTTTSLVSRCIEALILMHDGDGDGDGPGTMTCLNDVLKLQPGDFRVLIESINERLTNHDLLYRIVDLYLKGYTGKMTEEQKIRMCNYIDCTMLSSQVLMHAVQNPRMPLRFVVQAMFIEQMKTRRSLFSAASNHNHNPQGEDSANLSALLQRDAALRQVAQLKAAISTTNSRIQSLEKELSGMRKCLQESENTRNALNSGRSQSSRFSSENKIAREQIGSVSSASFRVVTSKNQTVAKSSSSYQESYDRSPLVEKRLGRRFIDGLKSALRITSLVSKKKLVNNGAGKFEGDGKNTNDEDEFGDKDVIVVKKDLRYRR